ncbi:MAG: YkvA family protein [Longimicrobiales bacterium]
MDALLKAMLIGLGMLVGAWAVMGVLAARLPPGLLKDLAGFLPSCVTMLRRLRRDPRVPTRVKVVLLIAAVWVVSPIDLIPEFLPIIGPLDDVLVVALALRYAGRHIPRAALFEAWPGDPVLLSRVLGLPRTSSSHGPL